MGFLPINVTAQAFAEKDFNNTTAYTSYRFTVTMTENVPAVADGFQVSEIEFLGVKAGTTTTPTLTFVHGTTPGTFTITSSLPAELYSATSLVSPQWVDVGPITNSVTITAAPGTPAKSCRVGIP